jgi:hypothetical protein
MSKEVTVKLDENRYCLSVGGMDFLPNDPSITMTKESPFDFDVATLNALSWLKDMANNHADGHYTICKFTSNYRVGLGTPNSREDINNMYQGSTFLEAVKHFQIHVENPGDPPIPSV